MLKIPTILKKFFDILDGKLLKATTKGINIVKYSNGTVKKIIVQ